MASQTAMFPLFSSISKLTTILNPQDLTHFQAEVQGVNALGKGWKCLSPFPENQGPYEFLSTTAVLGRIQQDGRIL